jgi:hypothetical protein
MENTISTARPDVVAVETTARPTAPPVRIPFSEVLSSGALALVQGAQAAVTALPGAPVVAAAVRGGGLAASTTQVGGTAPEGPGATSPGAAMMPLGGAGGALTSVAGGATGATGAGDANIEGSLAQSQQMNLYYLQVQEQVNDQNRAFTLLSNVIEMEHNTAKSAIGNIH